MCTYEKQYMLMVFPLYFLHWIRMSLVYYIRVQKSAFLFILGIGSEISRHKELESPLWWNATPYSFQFTLVEDKTKSLVRKEKAAKSSMPRRSDVQKDMEQVYQNQESLEKQPDNTYCNAGALTGIPVSDLKQTVATSTQSEALTNEYKVSGIGWHEGEMSKYLKLNAWHISY